MKIINLGHASFKIEGKDFSVVFDPYKDFSVPGLMFPRDIECNHLFISHDHYDHNARELVMVKEKPNIVYKEVLIPHDGYNGSKRGMCKGVIIEIDGYKIGHLGDIGDIRAKNLNEFKDLDFLFCPINGFYTIGASEAYDLVYMLKPKIIIPMHYEIKEKQIGYPDGGQIDVFNQLFKDTYLVKGYELVIKKDIFNYRAIEFSDCLQ